jgi:hypothetical protein
MAQSSEFRQTALQQILHRLYYEQLTYWNKELTQVRYKNTQAHAKSNFDAHMSYGIYHNGKRFFHEHMSREDNEDQKFTPLPIHPERKDLHNRMDVVADELGDIVEEKYAVNRYISNLLTFPFTLGVMKDILGDMLYESCEAVLSRHVLECSAQWGNAAQESLSLFVTENASTGKKLKERLLVNLITLDASKIK